MIAYIVFITVMPLWDYMFNIFNTNLIANNNQFYTSTVMSRIEKTGNLGWIMPFGFIAIGIIYVIISCIKREKVEYEYEYEYNQYKRR